MINNYKMDESRFSKEMWSNLYICVSTYKCTCTYWDDRDYYFTFKYKIRIYKYKMI